MRMTLVTPTTDISPSARDETQPRHVSHVSPLAESLRHDRGVAASLSVPIVTASYVDLHVDRSGQRIL